MTVIEQAGFYPVRVSTSVHQVVNLMLLPRDGTFHFARARWADVQARIPKLARIVQASVNGDPGQFYDSLIESSAPKLACLLNIATVMSQVFLPQGGPLDYLKALVTDDLRQDRFFAWTDPSLVQQCRLAVQRKLFTQEPDLDLLLHTDPRYGRATSSFKQIQFGEANLQLTFHEETTKQVNGQTCVLVEPDIDYYKDPAAHALLEVIPNALTGSLTDPKIVYVLRWMAGQQAGIPEFDPLYTIE